MKILGAVLELPAKHYEKHCINSLHQLWKESIILKKIYKLHPLKIIMCRIVVLFLVIDILEFE